MKVDLISLVVIKVAFLSTSQPQIRGSAKQLQLDNERNLRSFEGEKFVQNFVLSSANNLGTILATKEPSQPSRRTHS